MSWGSSQSGLQLNKDKCDLCTEEIKFLCHIFFEAGVRSDPEKIKAIVDMKIPSLRVEL